MEDSIKEGRKIPLKSRQEPQVVADDKDESASVVQIDMLELQNKAGQPESILSSKGSHGPSSPFKEQSFGLKQATQGSLGQPSENKFVRHAQLLSSEESERNSGRPSNTPVSAVNFNMAADQALRDSNTHADDVVQTRGPHLKGTLASHTDSTVVQLPSQYSEVEVLRDGSGQLQEPGKGYKEQNGAGLIMKNYSAENLKVSLTPVVAQEQRLSAQQVASSTMPVVLEYNSSPSRTVPAKFPTKAPHMAGNGAPFSNPQRSSQGVFRSSGIGSELYSDGDSDQMIDDDDDDDDVDGDLNHNHQVVQIKAADFYQRHKGVKSFQDPRDGRITTLKAEKDQVRRGTLSFNEQAQKRSGRRTDPLRQDRQKNVDQKGSLEARSDHTSNISGGSFASKSRRSHDNAHTTQQQQLMAQSRKKRKQWPNMEQAAKSGDHLQMGASGSRRANMSHQNLGTPQFRKSSSTGQKQLYEEASAFERASQGFDSKIPLQRKSTREFKAEKAPKQSQSLKRPLQTHSSRLSAGSSKDRSRVKNQDSASSQGKHGSQSVPNLKKFKTSVTSKVPPLNSEKPILGLASNSYDASRTVVSPRQPIEPHKDRRGSKKDNSAADQKRKQLEKAAGIDYFIREKNQESNLSLVWSKVVLLIHTYNFVTVFFFLGIPGFPSGFWLLLEIVSELLISVDFILRLVIRLACPKIWDEMWLLQDKGSRSRFHLVIRLVGSIPQSLILCLIFGSSASRSLEDLTAFKFAMLRCLKLLRLRQISQYFEKVDFQNRRSKKHSFLQGFMVVYYFFLATHFIGCMWLLVARLEPDPDVGWFSMARFNEYEVSTFEKYIESLFFVVATMTGLGYGNIVPSTNAEWLTDCLIMITGASIYANFFANFAVEIYKQNKRQIENQKHFDQARQFAQNRQLSDELKKKVRHYYLNLRLNFSDFKQKYEILKELPDSLQGELSLVFNRQLIQEVKFFQLAEPRFIMAISRLLKPKMSIAGEYVVKVDEVATQMYFINSGIVEILATDNHTVLAYQGPGCYFGEIGVFLTGKRSCSVKVRESAILFAIGKKKLFQMLQTFPMQAKFLRAVGRQRLLTTAAEDLRGSDAQVMKDFVKEHLVGDQWDQSGNYGFLGGMSQTNSMAFRRSSSLIELPQKLSEVKVTRSLLANANESGVFPTSRQRSRLFVDQTRKPRLWQTTHYNKFDYFLIVPFSPLFYIWSGLLLATVCYDTFMVPFSIALSFDFSGIFYLVDAVAIVVYALDIFMRSKTAITRPETLCFERHRVMHHYVNSWLVLDLLACLPFEYFMLPFATDYMYQIRFVRLFRLCKGARVYELIRLVQTQSDFPSWLLVFMKLSGIFVLAAHFMSCFYIFIGRQEEDGAGRFDGQTMFGDMLNRNFITLPPASEMSPLELYWQFLYLSSCTMGAVMYGDIIPYSLAEQLFTFGAMFAARIYLAFVFAEAANYLSQLHMNKSVHNQRVKRIKNWMRQNNFPAKLVERVTDYHGMLWDDFQGINVQDILADLPNSLRHDVRTHMLQNLILNWEAFPKANSQGAMQSVIQKLQLILLPKGEYVIRFGQVAEEMYFLVKGVCRVLNEEGEELAILRQGQNFGEMALLEESNPLRMASVVTVTKCSLAVLTKKDFALICELYPEFQNKIFELAKQRKIANLQKEKDAKILKQQTTTQLGVVLEEENPEESSSFKTSSAQSSQSHQPPQAQEDTFSDDHEHPRVFSALETINEREDLRASTPNPERVSAITDTRLVSPTTDEPFDRLTPAAERPITIDQGQTQERLGSCASDDERSSAIQGTVTQSSQPEVREDQETIPLDINFNKTRNGFMSPPQQYETRASRQSKQTVQFTASINSEDDAIQLSDRVLTDTKELGEDQVLLNSNSQPQPANSKKVVSFAMSPSLEDNLKPKRQDTKKTRVDVPEPNKFGLKNGSPSASPFSPNVSPSNKVHPLGFVTPTAEQLQLQRRKSSITYSNVEQYINITVQDEGDEPNSFLHKCLSVKNAVSFLITLASIYNIVFVPLSFAFRIQFEGVFLTLEVLTVFFYLVDICLRWSKLNNYYQLEKIPDSRLDPFERRLKNDIEQLHKKVRIEKLEIGCSVAACLPLVSIFSFLEIYRPWPFVCLLASMRLVKLRPILQVFDELKNRWDLNVWRIVEVITFYYLICHYVACLLLANVAFEPDARDNWLRRIPVPQDSGIRDNPSVFTDMSSSSVYVHAIYFVVNTISHVAIGDITSVTTEERIFNAFLILLGTFIYSFLFGNITAIVSSLAPSQNMEFYRQYNFVMSKIKNGRTPLKTIVDVNHYFDYQWSLYRGLDIESALEDLPESIKSDVLLSRYQDTVETSLLFRESSGQIDVALAYSIFKKIKIQVYQNQEFILKVGQHCTDTLIILDGQVQVYGVNERETLGILSAGSHYGNDLAGDRTQAQLSKFISIQKSHLAMHSAEDNFDSKSLVHLVAKSFVVVGALSQSDLQQLYVAYPKWKTMVQTLNRFLFELCKISVEKHAAALDRPLVRKECAKLIQNHLTFSTERTYEDILEMDLYSNQLSIVDLTRVLKHHYIQLISPSISHEQRTHLQKSCMLPHTQFKSDALQAKYGTGRGGEAANKCCSDFYVQVNSRPKRVLDLLQLLNLVYIAFSTPMYISFEVRVRGLVMLLEAISLVVSLFVVILNLRTPVIVKGKSSLEFRTVVHHYWQNGLLIDLCGVLPFSMLLGGAYTDLSLFQMYLWIGLKALRIISSWQAVKIFAQFEVYIKSHNLLMGTLKASLMLFFLGHWIACSWHLVNVLETRADVAQTWASMNSLEAKTVSERYLLCYYAVLNVVTSVGYGDMYPVTDFERVFIILMINAGDVLFALAFGLLAQLTMQKSQTDQSQKFLSKMLAIQQIMGAYNISQAQRDRVEEYFSFVYYYRRQTTQVDHEDLEGLVPPSLIKEIIFHQNQDLLQAMFKDFGSENLVKELSTVLQGHVFLPGDYIINKGEIGEEMYFIVDGEVLIIAADKQTVVTKLRKGQYFGEIAIFFSTKRTSYVQADSFCVLNSLKKRDLDRIVKSYPLVAKDIAEKTKQRMKILAQFNQQASTQQAEEPRGQNIFTNLLHDSLLSESEEDEERNSLLSGSRISRRKSASVPSQMLKQSSGAITDFGAQSYTTSKRRNSTHQLLIQEKAQPMMEALREHSHALGPESAKLLTALEEHTPKDSVMQRRSSILLGKEPLQPQQYHDDDVNFTNQMEEQLQNFSTKQRGYSQRNLMTSSVSKQDPILSRDQMTSLTRQQSHRSNLTGSNKNTPKATEESPSQDGNSAYSMPFPVSARSINSVSAAGVSQPLNQTQAAAGLQRGAASSQQAEVLPQTKQAHETEAVSVRRVFKRERRLSRITLNRNLTLNQTSGLKLQWTVGN